MENYGIRADLMKREELTALRIRQTFECFGYRKYRMSRFEEYALYADNTDFLKSRSVITFNDLDGHVMALKPDVTLSIVKNTRASSSSTEKLYYQESVFRLDRHSRSYREIGQLGLECIGKLDIFAKAEVLRLAAKTLAEIGENWIMSISHMGFLLSMMDSLNIIPSVRDELMECFRQRNRHELAEKARGMGLTPMAAGLLTATLDLEGEVAETLEKARALAMTQAMSDALDEVEALCGILLPEGFGDRLRLDFSLINDEKYYSGIVFQGFEEGLPRPVLTGGYYGSLLRKFGRDLDAIGFAVCLNDLNLLYSGRQRGGTDALLLYGAGADPEGLIREAGNLMDAGMRVRTERGLPADAVFDRIYQYTADGLKEVTEDVQYRAAKGAVGKSGL